MSPFFGRDLQTFPRRFYIIGILYTLTLDRSTSENVESYAFGAITREMS